jgi:hypothetical protein
VVSLGVTTDTRRRPDGHRHVQLSRRRNRGTHRTTDLVARRPTSSPKDGYVSQTVGEHESVGFRALILAPPNSDIRYHFEVTFDSGKTAAIDDGGKPFRIVSFPTSPARVFVPTSLTSGGPTGLYQCQWKAHCDESYNSVLKGSSRTVTDAMHGDADHRRGAQQRRSPTGEQIAGWLASSNGAMRDPLLFDPRSCKTDRWPLFAE